jgi:hypothetical protein
MQPRRKQPSITIRSSRAVTRLKLLTRNGRSQADVIEEALERMPLPKTADSLEARKARIMTLIDRLAARGDIPSMEEFDRREYDENGNPR